ncbi:MAG: phosphotransferase, partial [Candidatus Latescibacteria bacterium]|nr:phosphotransferase [Candidatus Latescibacterota bacterium]
MSERPEKALSMYDLGAITGFERLAGGTANVNWRVQTDRGEFVLRHRNRRYGSPERVKADHELKSHLAQIGLAVFAPLKSTIGTTWIELDSKIYELYPFVHG